MVKPRFEFLEDEFYFIEDAFIRYQSCYCIVGNVIAVNTAYGV